MSILMELQYRPVEPDDSRDDVRPNVLMVTTNIPWPLNVGGHLRTYHLLKGLANRCDVRLVAGVDGPDDPGVAELQRVGIRVRTVATGERSRRHETWHALRSLARSEPYIMFQRRNRAAMESAVRKELSREIPDVVFLDQLSPLVYRPLFPRARLIVDLHKVCSGLAAHEANRRTWPVSAYLRNEARLLRNMERRVAAEADTLMVVSDEERGEFQSLGGRRVRLVPNGVDCSLYRHLPVGRNHERPVLLHLGDVSRHADVTAAAFLASEVMPRVLQEYPHARLQIVVGRNPGPDVEHLQRLPGIEVHANVPEIGVYLKQATRLVMPLDPGGKTRPAILEAFAAGLPVVSTPAEAARIDCVAGQHLWVADRDRFAATVLESLEAPVLAREFAERGRQLAAEKYDWSVVGKLACAAVKETALGDC